VGLEVLGFRCADRGRMRQDAQPRRNPGRGVGSRRLLRPQPPHAMRTHPRYTAPAAEGHSQLSLGRLARVPRTTRCQPGGVPSTPTSPLPGASTRPPPFRNDGGCLVAPGVRPHDQRQHPPGSLPEIRSHGVLLVAGELPHHLLQVQAEILGRPVDREVIHLRHHRPREEEEETGGYRPRTPSSDPEIE
jgi:hypothetical protein